MRQGCVSLGEIQCDKCHRIISHSERYLVIDEEDGVEAEKGQLMHYCIECALKKGYASYKGGERGEKTLTFFP